MIFVTVSTGFFDPLIEACDKLRHRFDFYGQIGNGSYVPAFAHTRMMSPMELKARMAQAELVISHGGTGMLSMLYDLKKPTLVIPKQMKYGEANDGQTELAVKWAELGMAVLCLDLQELEADITRAMSFSYSWPTFPSVGKYLVDRLAGTDQWDYLSRHGQEPTTL